MSTVDLSDIRGLFAEEASTHLAALESGLLSLEADPQNSTTLNEVFRAAHSLKGAGSMLGFNHIAGFVHTVESAIDSVRSGLDTLDQQKISLLLQAHDVIRSLTEEEPAGKVSTATNEKIVRLQKSLESSFRAHSALAAAPRTWQQENPSAPAQHTYRIHIRAVPELCRNGYDPIAFIRYLKKIGTIENCVVKNHFPQEFDPELLYLEFSIVFKTDQDEAAIIDNFSLAGDMFQVFVEKHEEIFGKTTTNRSSEPVPPKQHEAKNYLRISAERLDALIDSVGEVVVTGSSLKSFPAATRDPALGEKLQYFERQMELLRETAMALRLFPLNAIFRRFERVVRDIAVELGKQVQLEIQGGQTEIDKNLLEGIYDPLVHIIRNSIDHGIETPEERIRKGKSPVGKVNIQAVRVGGMIRIDIEDDGAGLDLVKIEKKAREQGLIKSEHPSEKELIEAVFQPGFSTADAVTRISGRGVGMDIVRHQVTRLQGSVTMARSPAGGTIVTILLPLTLAIIGGFLIRCGNNKYILPLDQVAECTNIGQLQEEQRVTAIMNLRGEALPIVDLGAVLQESQNTPRVVVVTQAADRRYGLLVDEPLGELLITMKPIEHIREIPAIFSGVAILGTGQIVLVLDPKQLFEYAQRAAETIIRV